MLSHFSIFIYCSIVILIFLFLGACNQVNDKRELNLDEVEMEPVSIKRYGKAIFSLDTSDLQDGLKGLQAEYPVFLDGDLDDPGSIVRMKEFLSDPLLVKTNADCQDIVCGRGP